MIGCLYNYAKASVHGCCMKRQHNQPSGPDAVPKEKRESRKEIHGTREIIVFGAKTQHTHTHTYIQKPCRQAVKTVLCMMIIAIIIINIREHVFTSLAMMKKEWR